MYCGIVFAEDDSKDSQVAFLGEKLEVFTVTSNKEIIELVSERKPDLVAVNTGMEDINHLSDEEEDLKEDGFIFTPSRHDTHRVRRFQAFEGLLKQSIAVDDVPEFLRFNPSITRKELAIDGDSALESYGIETEDINSAGEFDAVLGAITARFYDQGQAEDRGIVVPEPLHGEEDDETEGSGPVSKNI